LDPIPESMSYNTFDNTEFMDGLHYFVRKEKPSAVHDPIRKKDWREIEVHMPLTVISVEKTEQGRHQVWF